MSSEKKNDVGILGGGLSGLSVAYFLNRKYEILEKEDRCGGLCKSIRDKGFTFDIGGHVIFSKDKEVLKTVRKILPKNLTSSKCRDYIFFEGRYVKYPFEQNLSSLSKKDNFECLYNFICNTAKLPSRNLKDWIYCTFGKGIAEKYLIPYNEKIWKANTEFMNSDWVKGRVPQPSLEDIIKSSIGLKTGLKFPRKIFYYPKIGGIQALTEALLNNISDSRIHVNFEVKEVRKKRGEWIVSNGVVEKKYPTLVSTIPVFDLINSLEQVPTKVSDAVRNLRYNSLIGVMIGLREKNNKRFTALYFPQNDVPFHRICYPINFSQDCAPPNHSSLLVEITSTRNDEIWSMSDREILEFVIERLEHHGIVRKENICYENVIRGKYAYPIYELNYEKNIKVIRSYLANLGIHLCGRFAEFEYINMDTCIRRAKDLAHKLS